MSGEYQHPITIQEAIKNIDCRKYLLPAIQRKFTWNCSQICVLFDSIMRGYPINTFMFWQVTSPEIRKGFRFYQFLEHYCERFEENNRDFDTKGHCNDDDGFVAVIDGQQRLNSLYLGLKGTYAYKMPRKWWPTVWDETVLPKRRLYLNLITKVPDEENEEMMAYDFRFLTADEYKSAHGKNDQWWFEVGNVLTMKAVSTPADVLEVVTEYLLQQRLAGNAYAFKALTRLYFAIRMDRLIHYYRENEQEMDHVLDIFIRTNHGGTPLSFSDLLMSIAVANWKNDAREQIDSLIESVRVDKRMGFIINRDFVLKASLMLTDANVRFRVSNFSSSRLMKLSGGGTKLGRVSLKPSGWYMTWASGITPYEPRTPSFPLLAIYSTRTEMKQLGSRVFLRALTIWRITLTSERLFGSGLLDLLLKGCSEGKVMRFWLSCAKRSKQIWVTLHSR